MSRIKLAALALTALLAATAGVTSLAEPKVADAATQPDTVTSLDIMRGMTSTPASFSYGPNLSMKDGSTHTYSSGQLIITASVPGKVDTAVLSPGWSGTVERSAKSSIVTVTNSKPVTLAGWQHLAAFDAVGNIPRRGTHSMTVNRPEVRLMGDIVPYAKNPPAWDYGGVTAH